MGKYGKSIHVHISSYFHICLTISSLYGIFSYFRMVFKANVGKSAIHISIYFHMSDGLHCSTYHMSYGLHYSKSPFLMGKSPFVILIFERNCISTFRIPSLWMFCHKLVQCLQLFRLDLGIPHRLKKEWQQGVAEKPFRG